MTLPKQMATAVLLFISTAASAQFTGYYTAESVDGSKEKVHFILEETGRFFISGGEFYRTGKWKQVDKHTVSFTFDITDLVDLYVSTGNNHGGQICFGGFADKKAFVRMSPGDAGTSFRPVYLEEPKCNYAIYEYVRVRRKECSEITVAVKLPAKGKDTTAYLYTYQIPEKYDEIYLLVNNNAFPRERNVTIVNKDGRYMLGNIELQKQPDKPHSLPQWLQAQAELLNKSQIAAFRKERYVKNGPVEKIVPQRSRQDITVADAPIISVACPDENPFPPVTLPPDRKQ